MNKARVFHKTLVILDKMQLEFLTKEKNFNYDSLFVWILCVFPER